MMSAEEFNNWRGSTYLSLDKRMQCTFKWAHRWNALLFFDEADTFIIKNEDPRFNRSDIRMGMSLEYALPGSHR
jgi:hypothetical protein